MISSLSGKIVSVALNYVIIEVGGVGLQVQVTPIVATQCEVGSHQLLFTSLLVREDSLTLYGLLDASHREFFDLLQTVTGIGPRVAQAALAAFPPLEISSAIASGNSSALEKIPGIGKKVAERLVLELKDKVKKNWGASRDKSAILWSEQLTGALTGLGYSNKEADSAIERVKSELGETANNAELSELLKLALSQSGKR